MKIGTKMKKLLALFAITAVLISFTNRSSADVVSVFDSSFTNPEFVDGSIAFGGANPDSIIGQGGFSISDSAGAGILVGAGGFQRALFGWNPSDTFDQALVTSLVAGSTIEMTASNLMFAPTAANVGVLGLSNVDGGNILGNSSNAGGVQFTWDGTNIFIDRNTNFTPNFDVNTGVISGEAFNYAQVWTANGDGSFEIDHFINGTLLTTSTNQTPNFDKSGTETTGLIQDFGGAGSWSVDGLSLAYEAIPEPATGSLLALASLGLVALRRRK